MEQDFFKKPKQKRPVRYIESFIPCSPRIRHFIQIHTESNELRAIKFNSAKDTHAIFMAHTAEILMTLPSGDMLIFDPNWQVSYPTFYFAIHLPNKVKPLGPFGGNALIVGPDFDNVVADADNIYSWIRFYNKSSVREII
jgi:hypothetical protein